MSRIIRGRLIEKPEVGYCKKVKANCQWIVLWYRIVEPEETDKLDQ